MSNLTDALQAIAKQNQPLKDPSDINREKLMESIKTERLNQGLTQRKLAQLANTSQATIARAETKKWISFWVLLEIAAALNKEISLN